MSKDFTLKTYKLPRQIEGSDAAAGLMDHLLSCSRQLCAGSTLAVPVLALSDVLKRALLSARRAGHAVRGFDNANERLDLEHLGIAKLNRQAGQGERISRLILLSNDGADNFYKKAERLLKKHDLRVLGCMIDADSFSLGGLLFGEGRIVKLVLIDHKDSVSQILMSVQEHHV